MDLATNQISCSVANFLAPSTTEVRQSSSSLSAGISLFSSSGWAPVPLLA